ncbi:MAG: SRPBCC family protein [Thermoanaerobaculia bacterium]
MLTEIEEREGGTVVSHFGLGPEMEAHATVTAWEPPHRFAAESQDLGPGAPSLATEWIVEARAGGMCVVRVVHSVFASGDDWDDQLASIESGWPSFFKNLRLYLTRRTSPSGPPE